MKNLIIFVLGIILIAALLFLMRYDISVHSPIIVKLDRWTGDAWVANSGVWMEIEKGGIR